MYKYKSKLAITMNLTSAETEYLEFINEMFINVLQDIRKENLRLNKNGQELQQSALSVQKQLTGVVQKSA